MAGPNNHMTNHPARMPKGHTAPEQMAPPAKAKQPKAAMPTSNYKWK